MNGRWLTILGIGEDGVLSPSAQAALAGASLVVGGARHLRLAAAHVVGPCLPWPSPMDAGIAAVLARRPSPVVVLASGDPFWFGVGSTLARHVPASEICCLPVPGAFSLACAALGWPLQDCEAVSLCGRPLAPLVPLLQPGARILALSAGAETPAAVAALLAARGWGASRLHVLEALGGPAERVRCTTAAQFALADVQPLNMVAIECAGGRALPLAPGLPDEVFGHDGQITKREVRAVTLSALAPRRGEMLWDVGAGSGSVGIEWCLRHPTNRAVAVEADPVRAARAARNAEALGAGLQIVTGRAPEALTGLTRPDAAFIGGGVSAPGVIDAVWAALPADGRLVANAVTIEGEAALIDAQMRLGGTLTRLGVERLDRVGGMRAFRPAMTVTQWVAVR